MSKYTDFLRNIFYIAQLSVCDTGTGDTNTQKIGRRSETNNADLSTTNPTWIDLKSNWG